ncbi:MAG: TPM domain-containing protein [Bacteroidia bacterium]
MARVVWIFFFALVLNATAKEPPAAPTQYRWVQDEVGLLSEDQEKFLLKKLKDYYDSTSTEIAIVLEKSLEGDDVFRYSQALAEKWGIGTKGKDNGVLIYIAYENNNPNLRKIWIQVGYGLEGAIPDVYANRIIREIMAPKFRLERYGEGLNDAVDVIIGLAAGEFEFDKKEKTDGIPIWVIILIVIVLIILFSRNNNGGKTYRSRRSMTGPIWTTGGWGGGGGFGGGGFGGGFGGGSFGGGGAGGSW